MTQNNISVKFLDNTFAVHNQNYSLTNFIITFHLHTIQETLILRNNFSKETNTMEFDKENFVIIRIHDKHVFNFIKRKPNFNNSFILRDRTDILLKNYTLENIEHILNKKDCGAIWW